MMTIRATRPKGSDSNMFFLQCSRGILSLKRIYERNSKSSLVIHYRCIEVILEAIKKKILENLETSFGGCILLATLSLSSSSRLARQS